MSVGSTERDKRAEAAALPAPGAGSSWERATLAAGASAAPPNGATPWEPVTLPAVGSDAEDHWFRTRLDVEEAGTRLRLPGLATVCDVFLDGEHVLTSESMFLEHELPVEPGSHELVVCARALQPLLGAPRRPRARWRTRVVGDGNLRWFRTTLLGRAPGFASGPPVVGPWRAPELRGPRALLLDVRTALDGGDGVLEVACPAEAGALDVSVAGVSARLPAGGGTVRLPRPERWWPHTHGEPALHELRVQAEAGEARRSNGFRELEGPDDLERDGLSLRVNGVALFARGAVWVPPPRDQVRSTLERARDAGMNIVRVVGTGWYEDDDFYAACDELGLLVWQDLMFANMDYPFVDPEFRSAAEDEVRQLLRRLRGRPSLAVLCGNSEIEQQASMLGLAPEVARDEFFAETVPALAREAGVDATYVPSAPTGGTLPFRTDSGVANYFGVGAYLRPLADARLAGVRFASECLAFANVPDPDPADRSLGVMCDVGADWDFADVRDHYLRSLHGIGPGDPRYWERSRHVTGELMAAVFGEWRRPASAATGGIVLWLRDREPGSGWGVLDHEGRPKLAWHHLRRALAPVAVWLVDEGLNGLTIAVANDTPAALRATLRLSLYRDGQLPVNGASRKLEVGPHDSLELDAEELLGRFVDIAYAYRFGPPQHDTVVATLQRGDEVLSQAFFYPVREPLEGRTAAELGLDVTARSEDGGIAVSLVAERVVHGVRLAAAGFEPADDGFDLEPGCARGIRLRPAGGGAPGPVTVRALDLVEPVEVTVA
jgi:beta-mannosidase